LIWSIRSDDPHESSHRNPWESF